MITTEMIKELRSATGVGIGDCKDALTESNGDFEKAKLLLREKGMKLAQSSSVGDEGIIGSYIHHNKRVGVMVEVNCQTDFATSHLQELARDIAMHIASAKPQCVSRDELPEEDVSRERQFLIEQAKASGRPEHIIETKIIPGQMERFYAERCLLDQVFVKDNKSKIKDLLADLSAKTGETVSIKRFTRFAIGE